MITHGLKDSLHGLSRSMTAPALARELSAVLRPAAESLEQLGNVDPPSAADAAGVAADLQRICNALTLAKDIAHQAAGDHPFAGQERSTLHVDQLLGGLLEVLRPATPAHTRILMNSRDTLPPIYASPLALRRAFLNILLAATQSAAARRGLVDIGISVDRSGYFTADIFGRGQRSDVVRVSIADNGIEHDSHVRLMIHALACTACCERTDHLGLLIAARLLEAQGCYMAVESHPGLGNVIRVEIPIAHTIRAGHGARDDLA